jgi:hypothetical protein
MNYIGRRKTMYKEESGHIVVETIGTFVPLVLLVISILSLVNIVSVQARIHYALTQTAMTLSVYSYTLEVTGLSEALNSSAKPSFEPGSVLSDLDSTLTSIRSLVGSYSSHLENAIPTIDGILESAKSSLITTALDGLVQPMLKGYLENDYLSGDEYLRRMGILDIWLESGTVADSDGNVKLTLQYEIDYTFGALPLPFGPTLSVTQTAITKAWLNGSGEGYW